MTRARSPQTPSAPGPERRPVPASERDPQTLVDRRLLAEYMGLPPLCLHKACRSTRRCCGPRGATEAFPGAVLPACLAQAFEGLYRPVLRWKALDDAMARIAAWHRDNENGPGRTGPARTGRWTGRAGGR